MGTIGLSPPLSAQSTSPSLAPSLSPSASTSTLGVPGALQQPQPSTPRSALIKQGSQKSLQRKASVAGVPESGSSRRLSVQIQEPEKRGGGGALRSAGFGGADAEDQDASITGALAGGALARKSSIGDRRGSTVLEDVQED